VFSLLGDNRTMLSASVSALLHGVPLKLNLHRPAGDIKLRQHDAYRTSESSDIGLHLAGVNKHRGLRVARCYQWRASAWTVGHTGYSLLINAKMRVFLAKLVYLGFRQWNDWLTCWDRDSSHIFLKPWC